MNKLYLIFSVVLIVLVTIFALTNNAPVTIKFFGFGEWESSVTVVMLACIAGGVAIRTLLDSVKKFAQGGTNYL